MPTPEQYLNGFNIKKNLIFGNYRLEHVDARERSLVRWNKYSYEITLIFKLIRGSKNLRDMDNLYWDIDEFTKKDRIIRTDSGRPYICKFNTKNLEYEYTDNEVILHFLGIAVRTSEAVARTY